MAAISNQENAPGIVIICHLQKVLSCKLFAVAEPLADHV